MWTNPGLHGGGLAPDGGMDTEERLVEQATMTKRRAKELGIDQKVSAMGRWAATGVLSAADSITILACLPPRSAWV